MPDRQMKPVAGHPAIHSKPEKGPMACLLPRLQSALTRLAGGGTHNELRGVFDFVDKRSRSGGRGGVGENHVYGGLTASAQVMIDGGQTGRGDGRGKDVVKAAHRNIARNTIARGRSARQNAQGSHVVNADERGGVAATADELGGQGAGRRCTRRACW